MFLLPRYEVTNFKVKEILCCLQSQFQTAGTVNFLLLLKLPAMSEEHEMLIKIANTTSDFCRLIPEDMCSDKFLDTRQCLDIFMNLGNYVNKRMMKDMKSVASDKERIKIDTNLLSTEGENNKKDDVINEMVYKIKTEALNEVMKESRFEEKDKIKDMKEIHQGLHFSCKFCKFIAPNYTILIGHNKLEHDKTEGKICIKCGFETSSLKEFRKHKKIVHSKKMHITQYRK